MARVCVIRVRIPQYRQVILFKRVLQQIIFTSRVELTPYYEKLPALHSAKFKQGRCKKVRGACFGISWLMRWHRKAGMRFGRAGKHLISALTIGSLDKTRCIHGPTVAKHDGTVLGLFEQVIMRGPTRETSTPNKIF